VVGVYSGWDDYSASTWKAKSVEDHLAQWEQQLIVALNNFDVVHFNSHSGKLLVLFPFFLTYL
jgi:hypothetical protein